jgi:hypothetical protein
VITYSVYVQADALDVSSRRPVPHPGDGHRIRTLGPVGHDHRPLFCVRSPWPIRPLDPAGIDRRRRPVGRPHLRPRGAEIRAPIKRHPELDPLRHRELDPGGRSASGWPGAAPAFCRSPAPRAVRIPTRWRLEGVTDRAFSETGEWGRLNNTAVPRLGARRAGAGDRGSALRPRAQRLHQAARARNAAAAP